MADDLDLMFSSADHQYMSRALGLAEQGLYTADPNPRVGCVLVRDGVTVGEGWHQYAGQPHAEVHALRQAGEAAKGATAYVTLEPCSHHGRTPPCADALIDAGVARVVVAMQDPSPNVAGQGIARLQAAGIETAVGLMSAQAEALNPGFVYRHQRGRPYIRCKVAASIDGRTAMASGESKWITSTQARQDVQRLRARSSAVVTGIGTVLMDDPQLNVRLDMPVSQPVRIVLDTGLQMPPQARMLSLEGNTWIGTASHDAARRAALEALGARVLSLPVCDEAGHLDLQALVAQLAQDEMNELLVEAGPILSGAFIKAGLVDELWVYLAPHLMGDAARGMFHLPGLEQMSQRIDLQTSSVCQIGADVRLIMKPQSNG